MENNKYSLSSGIYCFENKINNKKYIGQADNLNRRIKEHLTQLRHDKDECIILQNAWNKYGEENFYIYIIEECSNNLLNEKEIYWIKELCAHKLDGGYNICFGGEAPMKGRNHTEESKKKMSESKSGNLAYWYGKKLPDEIKLKISISHLGIKRTQETIEKIKETKRTNGSSWTGKFHTEETKQKMSKAQSGKKKKNSSSKYFGVCWDKSKNKWECFFRENKKTINLGYFEYEIEAAMAYNEVALEFFGWKAKLNEISKEEIENLWILE